jgi:hypothetical protein
MIFKVIIPRSVFNNDYEDIKLLFIGNIEELKIENPSRLYECIKKIENQGIDVLGSKDIAFLNNLFPNFRKTVGNTDNYLCKFIYQSIPKNINTHALNTFILDILMQMKTLYPEIEYSYNTIKKGIIPYYYSYKIQKNYLDNILNFIIHIQGHQNRITTKNFIETLTNVIGIKLPYKTLIENAKSLDLGNNLDYEYTAIELLNNSKIRNILVEHIPYMCGFQKVKKVLTRLEEDSIKIEDYIYNFENYSRYFITTSNLDISKNNQDGQEQPKSILKTSSKYNIISAKKLLSNLVNTKLTYDSSFVNRDDIGQTEIINLDNISNSEFYCILSSDILDDSNTKIQIPTEIKRVYSELAFKVKDIRPNHPIKSEDEFWLCAISNRNQFILNNNIINNTRDIKDDIHKTMDFMFTVNKQYWNKLTIDGYLNQSGMKLNLSILFKESVVSFYAPVIKYISGGEVQNYNVYLPFLKSLDSKIAKKYFNNVDILEQLNEKIYSNTIIPYMKKIKYNKFSSYLLYKIMLIPNEPFVCLNVFIFETGYVIMNIDNTNDIVIEQEVIERAFTFLNVILKKIKKLFNIPKLELLNPESSILYSAFTKSPKYYESVSIIEQQTNLDINLNFKSYYVFQKFIKKIVEGDKFDKEVTQQLLDISSVEYQKDFYLFITRNKLKNNKNILPLLNDVISRSPNFKNSFMTDNEIKYIYTQIPGFFHKSNVVQYMFNRVSKIKGTLTKVKEHTLIKETASLFNKTITEIQSIFKSLLKLDIQGKQNFHYFMTFTIKNDAENKCFNLKFQGYYDLHIMSGILEHIGYSFNQLFTEIINEPYPSLTYNLDMISGINALDKYNDSILNSVKGVDLNNSINDFKIINSCFTITNDKGNKDIVKGNNSVKSVIPKQKIVEPEIIDLETIDLDMDLASVDLNMDMDFQFDLDIDMDTIEQLEMIEGLDNIDGQKNNLDKKTNLYSESKDDKNKDNKPKVDVKKVEVKDLEVKELVGKSKKLSEAEYINIMRRKFDPELYEPPVDDKQGRFKPDRHCPSTEKRVPMIVSKEQLDTFDPKSFNGYMRYRDNYYICPRLWDAKAEKPISVEAFIKNGMRSPYSEGELVSSGPSKKLITDKYNVILRKPTTSKYWSEPGLHKDWPEELRNTEREAYPALTKVSTHPKKLCLPCCRLNKPDEFDTNKKEIQEITRPQGYNQCKDSIELKKTGKGIKGQGDDVEYIKYENYVSNQIAQLKSGRLGLLPDNLDLLLNNVQSVFLGENENTLIDGSNVLLRCGLTNNKEFNILESIAQCMETPLNIMLNNIINKIQPEDFMELNNGSLVDEFYVGPINYLPTNENDINKFGNFCSFYDKIFTNLQINKVAFVKELNKFKKYYKPGVDNHHYENFESEFKFLYKLYVSFYNYLRFLNSGSEIKQLHHVLDLFIKRRSWLFKNGMNIIIFNKDKSSLKCGYHLNEKATQVILLVEEEENVYLPIIQVRIQNQSRVIRKYILDIDNSLNISSKVIDNLHIKKPQFKKSLELLTERLEAFIKIIYIKKQVCNFDLSFVNEKMFEYMKRNKFVINTQYFNFTNASGQCDYIGINSTRGTYSSSNSKTYTSTSSDIILPIYKKSLMKYTITNYYGLLSDITKSHLDIYKYFTFLYGIEINNKKKSISSNSEKALYTKFTEAFGYNIQSINVERINIDNTSKLVITGIYFMNGLLMPVLPTLFDKQEYKMIYEYLFKEFKIKLTLTNNIIINSLKYNTNLNNSQLSEQSTGSGSYTKMLRYNNTTMIDMYSECIDTLEKSITSIISDMLYKNRKSSIVSDLKNTFTFDILEENETNKNYLDSLSISSIATLTTLTTRINKPSMLLFTKINTILKKLIEFCKTELGFEIVNELKDDVLFKLTYNTISKDSDDDSMYTKSKSKTTKSNKMKTTYEIINYKPRIQYLIKLSISQHSKNIQKGKIAKHKFTVLEETLNIILTNIISRLIMDIGFRNNFFNGKLIDMSMYSGIHFDTIINKNMYNKETMDFIEKNNLGIICSPQELNFIIKNNLISKYRREYNVTLDTVEEHFKVNKKTLTKHQIEVFNSKLNLELLKNKVSLKRLLNLDNLEELSSLSSSSGSSSKDNTKIIVSTIFNSKGLYNPHAQVGECKLPYRNIRGKLSYNCNPANMLFGTDTLAKKNLKSTDLICPTEIDKSNKPVEFGYCPEKSIITQERMGIKKTYGGISGEKQLPCQFPYLFFNKKIINPLTGTTPLIRINFSCFKKRKEEGSWCFTSALDDLNKEMVIEKKQDVKKQSRLLIGATKQEDIYIGKWNMDNILDERDKKQIDKKKIKNLYDILGYKELKCIDENKGKTNQLKIEAKLDLSNIKPLTLEEYDHSFCMLSESKKGYTKKQLYLFGRDILKIPYTEMINKNGNILSKKELCIIFEPEITRLAKEKVLKDMNIDEDQLDLKKVYTKDPESCNLGEGKGGYKALELRNIATTFLGLKFDDAFKMKKEALCNYIIPRIFNENYTDVNNLDSKQDIDNNKNDNNINNNRNNDNTQKQNNIKLKVNLYPKDKDIMLCEKPLNRGGIPITTVREIAKILGIKFKERAKVDICVDIRNEIEKIKNIPVSEGDKEVRFKDKLKLAMNNNSIRGDLGKGEFMV